MAKLVQCLRDEVDEVLGQHERDWVLVAVVAYYAPGGLRLPDAEVRELYFERRPEPSTVLK
jgi:hypothetical protein